MALKISIAPTTEPLTTAEAKAHCRIDSGSFADNLTSLQSIAPGSHAVASLYSLVGTAVDVLGYSALVLLESGTNGASGTVDVKLQDSDDNTTFADVASGAFTQLTTANDNATFEKAYTGTKQYLRVVCTVAVIACEFGVSILKDAPTGADDDLLNSLITTARQHAENVTRRALITQIWELWLDAFPAKDVIEIPLPPILTGGIGSIKYYDTANTEATMTASDYFLDFKSEPGRVVLGYGKSWPSTTLRTYNGVCVTFTCGYGAAAAVPKAIKQAMLLIIGHLYEHREATSEKALINLPMAVDALLYPYRVWSF